MSGASNVDVAFKLHFLLKSVNYRFEDFEINTLLLTNFNMSVVIETNSDWDVNCMSLIRHVIPCTISCICSIPEKVIIQIIFRCQR